ncbi:hypothetical protein FDP41_005090 [Naegleria fowleri]|uniref:Uncharacterized protein n=1 Tax=Naegleria fowleri TaxID=5763 RepID=A0A6A5BCX8_NAEFO|nr:uncharacterized protein FDP41_005090 [Naegleria fowleri]KAF0975763.1 hypothetical protein FDP41_005090 [Naegleria fowleri]
MASGYPLGKQPSSSSPATSVNINAARILPHDEDTNDRVMLPSLSHQQNITLPSIHELLSQQQDGEDSEMNIIDTCGSMHQPLNSDPLLNPLHMSPLKPSQMLLANPSISSSPFIRASPSSSSSLSTYRFDERPQLYAHEPNILSSYDSSNPSQYISRPLPSLTVPSLQKTPSPPLSRNSPSLVTKYNDHNNDFSGQQEQLPMSRHNQNFQMDHNQKLILGNSSSYTSHDIYQQQSPSPFKQQQINLNEMSVMDETGKIVNERGMKTFRKQQRKTKAKLENQESKSSTLNFVNNFVSSTPVDSMTMTLGDIQDSSQSVQFSMHSPRSSKPKRGTKKATSDNASSHTASSSDEATQKTSNDATRSQPAAIDGLFMEFVGVQNPKKRKEYRDIITYKDEFFTDSYKNTATQKRLRESSSKYRSKQPLNTDKSNKHANKEKE